MKFGKILAWAKIVMSEVGVKYVNFDPLYDTVRETVGGLFYRDKSLFQSLRGSKIWRWSTPRLPAVERVVETPLKTR